MGPNDSRSRAWLPMVGTSARAFRVVSKSWMRGGYRCRMKRSTYQYQPWTIFPPTFELINHRQEQKEPYCCLKPTCLIIRMMSMISEEKCDVMRYNVVMFVVIFVFI